MCACVGVDMCTFLVHAAFCLGFLIADFCEPLYEKAMARHRHDRAANLVLQFDSNERLSKDESRSDIHYQIVYTVNSDENSNPDVYCKECKILL